MFVIPNDATTTSFVTRSSQLFNCFDSICSELSSETSETGEYDDDQLEVNETAAETLKNRKSAKLAKVIDNNSDDDF